METPLPALFPPMPAALDVSPRSHMPVLMIHHHLNVKPTDYLQTRKCSPKDRDLKCGPRYIANRNVDFITYWSRRPNKKAIPPETTLPIQT